MFGVRPAPGHLIPSEFDELWRLLVDGGEDDANAEQCTEPRDCAEGGIIEVNS